MPDLKTKKVNVTVHLDVNHEPNFSFTTNLPTKGKKKDQIIFNKGDHDGFEVRYHLDDPFHVYTFGTQLNEALYSSPQPVCPVPKGQWEQFVPIAIEDNGLTLVVHNKNDTVQEFGYMLRVIKQGDTKYLDLDPIGTNQNGNTRSSPLAAAMVFVAGAAAGYVAAQAAMPLANDVAVLGASLAVGLAALGLYFVIRNQPARTA